MLPDVISVGVQTWGTDVAALRHYWQATDDLGFARITYGDGLWGWTHDDWTMLGALAGLTRRARLGPPVWLAAMGPGALGLAAQYAAAGAPDLMLGFADFPATRMIEAFAERVLPGLATHR